MNFFNEFWLPICLLWFMHFLFWLVLNSKKTFLMYHLFKGISQFNIFITIALLYAAKEFYLFLGTKLFLLTFDLWIITIFQITWQIMMSQNVDSFYSKQNCPFWYKLTSVLCKSHKKFINLSKFETLLTIKKYNWYKLNYLATTIQSKLT